PPESRPPEAAAVGHIDDLRPPGFWKKRKRRWHAENTKFWPLDPWLFYRDLPGLIRDNVLPGHTPAEPLLDVHDRVITVGSCFAQELRAYLERAGLAADTFHVPEGLNNTYAILDYVSWCVTGADGGAGFRYDTTRDGDIEEWQLNESRDHVLRHLRQAGA